MIPFAKLEKNGVDKIEEHISGRVNAVNAATRLQRIEGGRPCLHQDECAFDLLPPIS